MNTILMDWEESDGPLQASDVTAEEFAVLEFMLTHYINLSAALIWRDWQAGAQGMCTLHPTTPTAHSIPPHPLHTPS